jgi:hypothetical protein
MPPAMRPLVDVYNGITRLHLQRNLPFAQVHVRRPALPLRFCARQVCFTLYFEPKPCSADQLLRRRVLHDACPSTASLHRLFSANSIDGGFCLVSDAPQVGMLFQQFETPCRRR